ncbi:replicative DNA helicase [Leptospira sp. GIMC2001]|uniref:replicative DNA helicase n=1 Tax=Leptospira sp. GIMC2001 TaxID=1513297 RepID=UPI00234A1482|nr:replicative DNA helicase [Leptospira sp. GIMC2001]WCL48310.1 replicative DNA helicase [Leptospira sp. GIMC2001]
MNPSSLHEVETEKALLGSLLMKGTGGKSDLALKPDDFYLDIHKRVYGAIDDLIAMGVDIDPVSVINLLKETSRITDETRDVEYIMSIYRDTIPTHSLEYYIGRIKRLSDRRKYNKALLDSQEILHEAPGDNDAVFSRIEQALMDISRVERSKGLRPVESDRVDLIDYVKILLENKGGIMGLRSHYTELDEVTGGFKPHELIVLAARPGNGKTTFALNIALNVALKEKKTVAIFTTEMSRMEMLLKMVCAEARVDSRLLQSGSIPANQSRTLLNAITNITSAPIYIDDSGNFSIQEISARVRQLKTTENPALVIVDYIQLVNDPKVQGQGRQVEVSSVSRHLKLLTRDAGCPILALSQMSREVEKRSKDQRPVLSDLRESGAIEQDADIVAFIHREEIVKGEETPPEKRGKAELIIAKNRAGALKTFELLFTPKYSRFDNISGEPQIQS